MFFILLVTFFAFAHATFECPKRPNFTAIEPYNCCTIQRPKWDNLPIKCSKYMIALNKPVSSCAYECVMNDSRILKNGKFEVPNIRPMLRKFYSDEISLEVFIMAFENCAINFNKMLSEQNTYIKNTTRSSSSRKSPSSHECSPIALKFILCASREVFINCPAIYWTSSSTCAYIREYSINCDTKLSLVRKSIRRHSSG